MRNKTFCFFILMMANLSLRLEAQDKSNHEFGKIGVNDFKWTAESIDSGASAVIISDIGSTSFEGNSQGFFILVFKRFLRVKIISKTGFDISNYQILLYHDKSDFEKLYAIKGSTFNLENGVVVETKLDDKSVYGEQYNKDLDLKKFSMPAIKVGSIYDLEYIVKSPFTRKLRPWSFQGEYPCYWSEYKVTIPPPFHYMMQVQGDTNFDIHTRKEVFGSYMLKYENGSYQSQGYRATGFSKEFRWVKRNVPALHEEPFITTLKNYYSRVSFQLNYFQWEVGYGKADRVDYLENWSSTAKTLLRDENFGLVLNYENNWMKDELKGLNLENLDYQNRAIRIFDFIRDNFKVTYKNGYDKNSVWAQNSLKEVFKSREGNVAEINLLLTSMLRHANIVADPLILSTRSHGIANTAYPLIIEYNYVICIAYLGDKMITLDASQPYNGFGQLPEECYNGWGHVMNEEKPLAVMFDPDSISESSVSSIFIINDQKGQPSGTFKKSFGKLESYEKRDEIKSSSAKNFAMKIQTLNGSDLIVENVEFDSLENYTSPLTIRYDFEFKKHLSEDIFIFNPMMNEGYSTNPFKSMERFYPIEIPFKIDDTYLLNMEIPAGYQVDEIPKSVKVAYNESDGLFEYLIQKNDQSIQMRVRLIFRKASFAKEEYTGLRDFFAYVVKKESEQIVFKKIK